MITGSVVEPGDMIISSRNRIPSTSGDPSSVLAILACALFFLGVTFLSQSVPFAALGTAALAGAWALTAKMLTPAQY
ncbi:hypothetical protein ACWIGI_34520 [Nocardia sp. NPDC055321]